MELNRLMIGADRFLALKWANYAFELFQTNQDADFHYNELKNYLTIEIAGKDSSRKTANQLRSMWLKSDDFYQDLRLAALSTPFDRFPEYLPILHLGMALNVFPIYRETIRAIGILERIIKPIPKLSIIDRVLETIGTRSSIPRIVTRVIQTLEDWQFVEGNEGNIKVNSIEIKNREFSDWFIKALITVYQPYGISITDFDFVPEKLLIQIPNLRETVQKSTQFTLVRDIQGREIINDSTR